MDYIIQNGELRHYGVRGMKWGVRRYQNADGTLTSAGRKKARKEYKEDNQKAFELGRDATIVGYAAAKSMKRTIKLDNKLAKQREKDPAGVSRKTKSLNDQLNASKATRDQLMSDYAAKASAAQKHCSSLMNKYGKEAVSSIKLKPVTVDNKSKASLAVVNERTNRISDYAIAGAASLTSVGIAGVMAAPFAVIMTPTSGRQKGRDLEDTLYRSRLGF